MNKIKSLRQSKNRNIVINLNHEFRQSSDLPYMDKTDDKTDEKADDEQPDTTDIPDLKVQNSLKKEKIKKDKD